MTPHLRQYYEAVRALNQKGKIADKRTVSQIVGYTPRTTANQLVALAKSGVLIAPGKGNRFGYYVSRPSERLTPALKQTRDAMRVLSMLDRPATRATVSDYLQITKAAADQRLRQLVLFGIAARPKGRGPASKGYTIK